MTYETKSGARYTVREWHNGKASVVRLGKTYDISASQPGISRLFPDRESAEAALKAYADSQPGWEVAER